MDNIGKNYNEFARSAADLCAFMVVCRHGQMSSAAREMKLSQPSLSQRIQNLETRLNRTLFNRTSKGVALTQDGAALYRQMENPLDQAASQFGSFIEDGGSDRVLISVDYAFASFWLLPRLPRIRADLGTTNVCILSTQSPVEFASSDTDLIIRMNHKKDVRAQETLLLPEKVSAIASASFKQAHPDIQTPEDLLRYKAQLLHLTSPSINTPWCGWLEWLEAMNTPAGTLVRETLFGNYEMIIRAASAGQGIALGWHGLIEDLLETTDLEILLPDVVQTDRGYFITRHQSQPSQKTRELQAWILEEASKI